MLHIPLVESSYWVCNISGENLYLINSDKNQIISMKMRIRQPNQLSWRAPCELFERALNTPLIFGTSQSFHFPNYSRHWMKAPAIHISCKTQIVFLFPVWYKETVITFRNTKNKKPPKGWFVCTVFEIQVYIDLQQKIVEAILKSNLRQQCVNKTFAEDSFLNPDNFFWGTITV